MCVLGCGYTTFCLFVLKRINKFKCSFEQRLQEEAPRTNERRKPEAPTKAPSSPAPPPRGIATCSL